MVLKELLAFDVAAAVSPVYLGEELGEGFIGQTHPGSLVLE